MKSEGALPRGSAPSDFLEWSGVGSRGIGPFGIGGPGGEAAALVAPAPCQQVVVELLCTWYATDFC